MDQSVLYTVYISLGGIPGFLWAAWAVERWGRKPTCITRLENNETCDDTIFNPGNLSDGIGHPPDEIFHARLTAYAISLAKRQ